MLYTLIRSTQKSLATAVLGVAMILPVSAAHAVQGDSIAIVNIQSIVKNSLASKDIQEQLEKKRATYQTQITKQEEELRKTDQELASQRSVLSQQAYDEKVEAFKKRVAEVQKDVQAKRTDLDKAYGNAMTEVQKVTVQIISELADKKGFTVAVPSSQILYAKDGLDISNDVLKELDKRLPKVKVNVNS